jgi:hypothetical protein
MSRVWTPLVNRIGSAIRPGIVAAFAHRAIGYHAFASWRCTQGAPSSRVLGPTRWARLLDHPRYALHSQLTCSLSELIGVTASDGFTGQSTITPLQSPNAT